MGWVGRGGGGQRESRGLLRLARSGAACSCRRPGVAGKPAPPPPPCARPHPPQSAARVQVTALGAQGASTSGGDWDDKPAAEPWSEQEQHKKAGPWGGSGGGWPGSAGLWA